VHHAADLRHVPVDVRVRRGVRRRGETTVDQIAIQVTDHDVVGGEGVVVDP
jgi:hypothetical protein